MRGSNNVNKHTMTAGYDKVQRFSHMGKLGKELSIEGVSVGRLGGDTSMGDEFGIQEILIGSRIHQGTERNRLPVNYQGGIELHSGSGD